MLMNPSSSVKILNILKINTGDPRLVSPVWWHLGGWEKNLPDLVETDSCILVMYFCFECCILDDIGIRKGPLSVKYTLGNIYWNYWYLDSCFLIFLIRGFWMISKMSNCWFAGMNIVEWLGFVTGLMLLCSWGIYLHYL